MSRLFVTAAAFAIASMVYAKPETSSAAPAAADPAPQAATTASELPSDAQPAAIGIDPGFEVFRAAMVQSVAEKLASEHPKLTMLLDAAQAKGLNPSKLRVVSSVDGFRRGGQRHPFGAQEYPLENFDPAQIETMLGEPNLTVDLV